PDMIAKTTEAWELSLNLGDRNPRKRMAGTRYHFNDTYREIMARGAAVPRIHAATRDGTLTGQPGVLTAEEFERKDTRMGPYNASSQLLLNPIADSRQTFRRDWIRYYDEAPAELNWRQMNRLLLVDPSEGKKKGDYCAMAVIGKGPDENYYLL